MGLVGPPESCLRALACWSAGLSGVGRPFSAPCRRLRGRRPWMKNAHRFRQMRYWERARELVLHIDLKQ